MFDAAFAAVCDAQAATSALASLRKYCPFSTYCMAVHHLLCIAPFVIKQTLSMETRHRLSFLAKQHAGIRPSARQTTSCQILSRIRLPMQIHHSQRSDRFAKTRTRIRHQMDLSRTLKLCNRITDNN